MDSSHLASPLFAAASSWPFVILGLSVAFIVVAITRLRMHANTRR